jgi:hypothetical protein
MTRRLIRCNKCKKERKVYGNRIKCCGVLQDITESMIVMVSAKRDKSKVEKLETSPEKTHQKHDIISDNISIKLKPVKIVKTKNKEEKENVRGNIKSGGIQAGFRESAEETITATV